MSAKRIINAISMTLIVGGLIGLLFWPAPTATPLAPTVVAPTCTEPSNLVLPKVRGVRYEVTPSEVQPVLPAGAVAYDVWAYPQGDYKLAESDIDWMWQVVINPAGCDDRDR